MKAKGEKPAEEKPKMGEPAVAVEEVVVPSVGEGLVAAEPQPDSATAEVTTEKDAV